PHDFALAVIPACPELLFLQLYEYRANAAPPPRHEEWQRKEERERFDKRMAEYSRHAAYLVEYSSQRETTTGITAINWQGSVLLFAGDNDVQCGTMREHNIQWLCELSSTPEVTPGLMIDCLQTGGTTYKPAPILALWRIAIQMVLNERSSEVLKESRKLRRPIDKEEKNLFLYVLIRGRKHFTIDIPYVHSSL
ncbi:hypothetical protein ALC53_08523, partial [Atta colombica]